MRLRTVQFVIQWTVASMLVGCHDSGNRPVVPPATPQVQIQPLTADKLAQIVGVTVWTAKYSGGPIECWLEIEEEGQSTLPKRFPQDFVGAGSVNRPTEGTINLWLRRREDLQGGELTIDVADAKYSYGLNKDAFTFAWGLFFAHSTKIGNGELMKGEPGKEFVVVEYQAGELPQHGKTPRRVRLKLMGRFPVQK
jgi:hypothetical protein